jgi:hypothetical protein
VYPAFVLDRTEQDTGATTARVHPEVSVIK